MIKITAYCKDERIPLTKNDEDYIRICVTGALKSMNLSVVSVEIEENDFEENEKDESKK